VRRAGFFPGLKTKKGEKVGGKGKSVAGGLKKGPGPVNLVFGREEVHLDRKNSRYMKKKRVKQKKDWKAKGK